MSARNTGKFLLGTLVGGAIGGITALLMAPQSGEETQKLIMEKRDQLQQDAEKRMDESQEYLEERFVEARNAIAELFSTGSQILDNQSNVIKVERKKPEKNIDQEAVPA